MIPACIGIIMDGNRRWAKERGLSTLEGHKKGYEKLKEVLKWCRDSDVKALIVYAFSTENWNRTKEEVSYLLDLFREAINQEIETIAGENARIRFLGMRERFPADIVSAMGDVERRTEHHTDFLFGIALSYGGRAEILSAVSLLCKERGNGAVSEEEFERKLWTAGISDPDIIIRTGGEKRLSNFLPWQSVYSELFFIDTFWPGFSRQEFDGILKEFETRERRRGK